MRWWALAALVAGLLAAPAAQADPGHRDRAFGSGGTVELAGPRDAAGAVVLPDDRIIVAGATPGRLIMLTASGRRDRRFGDRGTVRRLPSAVREPVAIVRDARGVVVLGRGSGGYGLAAFDLRGRPRTDFRTTVVRSADPYATPVLARGADGRLFVAVGPQLFGHRADGTLDPGFGDGGRAQGIGVGITSMAPGAGGTLMIGGGDAEGRLAVRRLTGTGVTDPAAPPIPLRGEAATLAAGPGGTVSAARLDVEGDGIVVELLRFGADGRLDPGYGRRPGGVAALRLGYGQASFRTPLVVEPSGRVVVGSGGAAITRATPRGDQDVRFGTAGIVRLAFDDDEGAAEARTLGIDRAGRIVVAGRRLYGGTTDRECGVCREDIANRIRLTVTRLEGGDGQVRVRRARRTRRGVVARVTCTAAARGRCRGSIRLEGRLRGRRAVSIPARRTRTVRIPARRARRSGATVAAARIFDGRGVLSTSRRRVRG